MDARGIIKNRFHRADANEGKKIQVLHMRLIMKSPVLPSAGDDGRGGGVFSRFSDGSFLAFTVAP